MWQHAYPYQEILPTSQLSSGASQKTGCGNLIWRSTTVVRIHCLCRQPEPQGTNGVRPLILGAGNRAGLACLWSATTGEVVASLSVGGAGATAPTSARGRGAKDDTGDVTHDPGSCVVGLDWVTADPNLVAVLTASGLFIVWDWAGIRGDPFWVGLVE